MITAFIPLGRKCDTKHIDSFFFLLPYLKVISMTLAKDSCVLRINDRVDSAPGWPLLTAGSQSPASVGAQSLIPSRIPLVSPRCFLGLDF